MVIGWVKEIERLSSLGVIFERYCVDRNGDMVKVNGVNREDGTVS